MPPARCCGNSSRTIPARSSGAASTLPMLPTPSSPPPAALSCIRSGGTPALPKQAPVAFGREAADSTPKDRLCHGAYPVHDAFGLVFAYMGPPEKKPPFPVYDNLVRPGYQAIPGQKYFYPCNWLQIQENTVDPTHTAFLHTIV